MLSQGENPGSSADFFRQRMAPIYKLLDAAPETERDRIFSRAMVSTCAELEISLGEFPRRLADPEAVEIVSRLEDHSIYWVQSYLQAEADWQKTSQELIVIWKMPRKMWAFRHRLPAAHRFAMQSMKPMYS